MSAVPYSRFSSFSKLSTTSYLLLLLSFLECIGGGVAYYLALYLGTSTTLSKFQIGQAGAMMGFGLLSGALCSVYITDRLDKKKLIVFSLVLLGISFFCLSRKLNFFEISVCAFTIGYATNIFLTTNNTLLLQSVSQEPDTLRLMQSLKAVSENLGTSCSMLLIMFFAARNYGTIFEGVGIFFILLAVNCIKYLTLTHTEITNRNQPADTLEFHDKKKFLLTISALFIVGILYAQQRVAYPLFLHDKYANFTITAALFWLDPIIVSLFQVKVTKLLSPIKINNQLAVGGFLLGMGLFLLIMATNLFVTIGACLIFMLGEMMFMPNSFIYCYESVGSKHKGMASGAWRSAYSLGLVLGPIIAGFLMDNYDYNLCWLLAGFLGLCLFVLFYSSNPSIVGKKLEYIP